MGRPKKDMCNLYRIADMFKIADGQMMTIRELRRALNGQRNPAEFRLLLDLLVSSGWFSIEHWPRTGPRIMSGQKMIMFYEDKFNATRDAELKQVAQ